jgi:hypothetical protein
MKRKNAIIVAPLLLGVSLWLWRAGMPTDHPEITRPETTPAAPPAASIEKNPGLTVLRDTPFDSDFTQATSTPERDLELVHEILSSARLLVKDHARIPLADNRDFTRFLSGGNPHRVAWIRPGHPRVNAAGELIDRWDTPLFFHQESSSRTGLRSAGPDRILWNEDDIVFDPATGS